MKTKNIFKVLALAMLMPAMLLTTACSSDDDVVVNNETTNKKGYPLQVTVNVTREGDDATRAEYNESTRKLEFSAYDKLFVEGSHEVANRFAGTLDYVPATGKFSGTIYTESLYEGTIDDLLNGNYATLLPADYGSYEYLEIIDEGYGAHLGENAYNSFATSKKLAVEQLSYEHGEYTSGTGFVLEPRNAILNITITGLTASTEVTAALSDDEDWTPDIEGEVTTDGSGNATFAIGLEDGSDLNEFSLSVAGNPITLVSSEKTLAAGKIYNITRGTGATVDLSTKSTAYTAQNGETLTGTLANNVKISIAAGATVILNGVSINANGDWTSGNYAGITCEGNATIILSGTNTVKGFYEDYPGIYVPENKTVTIQGTGSLTASSNGWAAGIGGGSNIACGNIEIQGGTITATGGSGRAGIGGGGEACGNITITGGTITATGGNNAAGIGGGIGECGNITITSGVTRVTATKGPGAPYSIGAGGISTICGTVTIGGVVTGNITDSPYTYPAPAPSYTMAAAATTSDKGKLICTAGHIHVYGEDAACTAGRVAKIIYVGTNGHATYNHGLALALEDMSTKLHWDNSGDNNDGKTAAEWCSAWNTSKTVTDAEWLLASKDQWDYMLGTSGAGSYTDLRDGFESVGGSNMLKGYYWSSTEKDNDNAWDYNFGNFGGGDWYSSYKNLNNYNVRACLAF